MTWKEDYWRKLLSLPEAEIRPLLSTFDAPTREEQIRLFRQHIGIITVETSSYCNRSCAYCPDALPEYGRKKKNFISDAAWRRLLTNLTEIDYRSTFILTLFNEPLADESIAEKIRQVRAAAGYCFLMLHTNGDFLDRARLEELEEAGIDALFISLHPAKNAAYDDEDRQRSVAKLFKRIGYGGEIDEIIPGRSIRADFNFGRTRLRVMCDNWNRYGTDRAGIVRKLSVEGRNQPCRRPQRDFVIAHDGAVFPCCQMFPDEPANHKYRLGNIENEDIYSIYAKRTAVMWRRSQFGFSEKDEPCHSCSDKDFADPESRDIRERLLAATK
jgi:radical SAM protein with 4Fe4S-binding SPASM domain